MNAFLASATLRNAFRYEAIPAVARWCLAVMKSHPGQSSGAAISILRLLLREPSREVILQSQDEIDWSSVWGVALGSSDVDHLLKAVAGEIEQHREYSTQDDDLAYGVDLLLRIRSGIVRAELTEAQANLIKDLISQAAELYSSVVEIEPNPNGVTDLSALMGEIEKHSGGDDETIPF